MTFTSGVNVPAYSILHQTEKTKKTFKLNKCELVHILISSLDKVIQIYLFCCDKSGISVEPNTSLISLFILIQYTKYIKYILTINTPVYLCTKTQAPLIFHIMTPKNYW